MAPIKTSFGDQIRREIDRAGVSRYRIAKTIGINESALSRFMAGGGISLRTLDAIATVLDLRVARGPQPRRKAK